MISGWISSSRTIARRSGAGFFLAIAIAAWGASAWAREWPAPTGHLNDFAHVVDPTHADSIESLAVELQQKTGAELAVVTTPDLGGEEIDAAATELISRWGIGRKGENDGVLILLALAERRVRIEPGYGLEGVLPDGRCGFIIRHVMGPDLSADRFGPGLLRGAQSVAAAIAKEKGVELTGTAGIVPPPVNAGGTEAGGIFLLLFLLVVFLVLGNAFNRATRGRRGWSDWSGRGGGWYGPWGGGGFGGLGGLGGGGGNRGGFGGFGGFGGGMSGGGGASGRF
jgi:uncharacterized protein